MNLQVLFREWERIRRELVASTTALTQEQLDWIPSGGRNSIGDLMRHIAEAERWWFASVVLGGDKFPEYTRDTAPTGILILKELESTRKVVLEVLSVKSIEDFDERYQVPGRTEIVSLHDICWHVFEHECRHRGQIFMLMRLQGLEPPEV